MSEHKVTIRVGKNGFVVERHEDHSLHEMWVYTGGVAAASAALCVQGMLDHFGTLADDHNLHVTAQRAAQKFAREAKPS